MLGNSQQPEQNCMHHLGEPSWVWGSGPVFSLKAETLSLLQTTRALPQARTKSVCQTLVVAASTIWGWGGKQGSWLNHTAWQVGWSGQ